MKNLTIRELSWSQTTLLILNWTIIVKQHLPPLRRLQWKISSSRYISKRGDISVLRTLINPSVATMSLKIYSFQALHIFSKISTNSML